MFWGRRVSWTLCQSGCCIPFRALPFKRGITKVKYTPRYKAQEDRQDGRALGTYPPGEWTEDTPSCLKIMIQGNSDGSF